MKRYIKPDIETIEMASIQLLADSTTTPPEPEESQTDWGMGKHNNTGFDMWDSNSAGLKSSSIWDDKD